MDLLVRVQKAQSTEVLARRVHMWYHRTVREDLQNAVWRGRQSDFQFAEIAIRTRAWHWLQHRGLKHTPPSLTTRPQHQSARSETLVVLIRIMHDGH
jgi:hypothetical protein